MSMLGCAGEPSARIITEMLFPNVATFRTNPADKAQKSSLWTWERICYTPCQCENTDFREREVEEGRAVTLIPQQV